MPDDAVVSAGAERAPEVAAPTVFGWPDPDPAPSGRSSWIAELSEAPLPGRAPTPAAQYPAPVAAPAYADPAAPAPFDRGGDPVPADDPLAPTQPIDLRPVTRRRPGD